MPDNNKIKRLIQGMFWAAALFVIVAVRSHAAFPADMDEKPVYCKSLFDDPDLVSYYYDPEFTQLKGTGDGEAIELRATKVTDKAIYGSFTINGKEENGWFRLKLFVADPDYDDKYVTVRSPMTVYTSSSLSREQDHIKKYSGVIIIGKAGDSRQVIYQKKSKKSYGIGWMSEDALDNTLDYDGREKQTLSDGTYLFRCGFVDNRDGGAVIRKQPQLTEYNSFQWKLYHKSNDDYYVRDTQTGHFLSVFTRDNGLSYGLCQTKKPDLQNGSFHLERVNGSYTLQSTKSGQYLGQDDDKKLILSRYRLGNNVCWRVSAIKRMLNAKAPMVFTQYDPQWCAAAYGSEGCMGTAGCGILAPVNAVYALSGQYMDVMELADYAVDKNYRIVGSGTDEGIFKAAARKYGCKYNFSWDGSGVTIKELKKKLQKGDTAVAHVEGHYVAIVAYNKKTNKFLLLDSNCLPKRDDTAFGDWITQNRLVDGALAAQRFFYYKLRDPLSLPPSA